MEQTECGTGIKRSIRIQSRDMGGSFRVCGRGLQKYCAALHGLSVEEAYMLL